MHLVLGLFSLFLLHKPLHLRHFLSLLLLRNLSLSLILDRLLFDRLLIFCFLASFNFLLLLLDSLQAFCFLGLLLLRMLLRYHFALLLSLEHLLLRILLPLEQSRCIVGLRDLLGSDGLALRCSCDDIFFLRRSSTHTIFYI